MMGAFIMKERVLRLLLFSRSIFLNLVGMIDAFITSTSVACDQNLDLCSLKEQIYRRMVFLWQRSQTTGKRMLFDRTASSYLPAFPFFVVRMCPSSYQRSVVVQSRDIVLFLFKGLLIIESESIDVRFQLIFFAVSKTLSPWKKRSTFCQSNRMFFVLFQVVPLRHWKVGSFSI